ncbi:TolC family protein [Ampullimonas aquatilis]|uniref:TolC family protein n=1 Tax=Ampullimonas aquatilis TaxID=1341549 RepID=UPI003C741BA5
MTSYSYLSMLAQSRQAWPALMAGVLLSGCASLSSDGGNAVINRLTQDRLAQPIQFIRSDNEQQTLTEQVNQLLTSPLTLDHALQIALTNNRGLQAIYAQVGIAEADWVQATRLANPGLSFSRTRRADELLIDRTFSLNLINFLVTPLASKIEQQRFEQVKLLVSQEALQVAAATRKAWFEAVAAEQTVLYTKQVGSAVEASTELARNMTKVGNWSKRDQLREESFLAEANVLITRSQANAISSREKLARLLGLNSAQSHYTLPERLPDLPEQALLADDLEQLAMQQRLDIQAAQKEREGLVRALGLTKATRLINVLELGYVRNSETNRAAEKGYEIRLEVPLFDWGGARVARAEGRYMQSLHQLADTALRAQSEVRESYQLYQGQYALAKHYRDTVVPLRKQIADENLLRYNGMLISVFELLADAREQINSTTAYLDALKGYWLAEADLQQALGGKLPSTANAAVTAPRPSVPEAAQPEVPHATPRGAQP